MRSIRQRLLVVSLAIAIGAACTQVSSYYGDGDWMQKTPDYDIAFIEFSERGNLMRRERLDQLLRYVDAQESGAAIVVFVHGWKHNAHEEDLDVAKFRRALRSLATAPSISRVLGNRRLVGVFMGWRGAATKIPLIEEATFWDRKSVAEEVGKGAVTEVLLSLEKRAAPRNSPHVLAVIGHSFGGAIVLSALSEVFLERVIYAAPNSECPRIGEDACAEECVSAKPFGHAVVLMNPAIEANHLFPLREAVSKRCFPRYQDKLLHVLSTEADFATHWLFPIGTALGRIFSREVALERSYRGNETIAIDETDLDRATVGNFEPYRTGEFRMIDGAWEYCSHAARNFKSCSNKSWAPTLSGQIPTRTFEPLALVYSDAAFMENHNDVLNQRTVSYIATIMVESRFRRAQQGLGEPPGIPECRDRSGFDFGGCFALMLRTLPDVEIEADTP